MTRRFRFRVRSVVLVAIAAAIVAVAIAVRARSPRERLGYELRVPAAWSAWRGDAASDAPLVPATTLETYRVPTSHGDGALVVARSPHVPRMTVAELLESRRYLHVSLPEHEIIEATEIEIDGRPAARFVFSAVGRGIDISPTGLGRPVARDGGEQRRTRREWITVPRGREHGALELFLHVPEEAVEEVAEPWAEVLESIQVAGEAARG